MLALHRGSQVVSFLPQVPRRRHNFLGNARALPSKSSRRRAARMPRVLGRPSARSGRVCRNRAGCFDLGIHHPLQAALLANVLVKRPPANTRFQWSFGFDIRFWHDGRYGSERQTRPL